MRSRTLSLFPFVLSLALGAPAFAQDDTDTDTSTSSGGISFEVLTIAGKEVGLGELAVGIDDCDNDAVIEVRLDNVPSAKESIDIYVGEACNSTTRNDADENSCTYVGNQPAGRTNDLKIEIHVGDLIDDCSVEQDATPKIWLLAIDTPKGSEDVGNGYAMISKLRVDTRAPDAPSEISGGSGEREIPVEWTTDESDLETFVVLIDPMPTVDPSGEVAGSTGSVEDDGGQPVNPTGGGWNGECGSSVLTPGADLSSISTRVKRKTINEATATHVELTSSDVDGNAAAIAVVAIDKAGNESPLSEIGCIYVVPTEGFWERYQQSQGAVDAGCACSALAPEHVQSGLPVLLALGWLARAARRRRSP